MAKKKNKSKKNKIISCPHGGIFAEDWFQLPECTEGCKFASECKVAERKIFETKLHGHSQDKPKPLKEKSKPLKSKPKKHKKREQDNRGLYIPRPALNKLLALAYSSCMRVYCFYMKEGMRQKTNRPWCNNYFTAKRLKCSIGTVVTAKNILIKAGFIKIVGGGGESGRFKKTFIELKYYPSKFVIENEEYKRRMDKYVEDFAEWVNVLTSEVTKRDVKLFEEKEKYKELRSKYRKLKGKKHTK